MQNDFLKIVWGGYIKNNRKPETTKKNMHNDFERKIESRSSIVNRVIIFLRIFSTPNVRAKVPIRRLIGI